MRTAKGLPQLLQLQRVGRPSGATLAVVAVLIVAGLLFETTAQTARGTQLRTDRTDLVGLIRSEQAREQGRQQQATALRSQIEAETKAEGSVNGAVAALQARTELLAPGAGLEQVSGPAVTVTLDDAPRNGSLPSGARPDDLVVHQQDVQAVVNALWAGGAESMTLMNQRVISTSAVRCVGNTLILQGQVYSPPYTITAIGNRQRLRDALNAAPAIEIYREYVQRYGLGWSVVDHPKTTLAAYNGPLQLRFARVPGSSSAAGY